jgi:hypothetical protein
MACLTNYTIQCKDVVSGKTGCFLFDTDHWRRTGEFKAISPVFANLVQFYEWDKANGDKRAAVYLERA